MLDGRTAGSGLVYPGYGTRDISQETCTGPNPCLIDLISCQNVPSFLIDLVFDEVSQTGSQEMTVFHCFGTVLTLFDPPIQANSYEVIGRNSVEYRPTALVHRAALHRNTELHQKDLRISY